MSEMNARETQDYINKLYQSARTSNKRINWWKIHHDAYDALRQIEYEMIYLIDLGLLDKPVRFYTQGIPQWGGTLYLTERQVEFEKVGKLWICKSDYAGIQSTGKTKEQAYRNLVKEYKVTVFSKEDDR